MIEKKEILYDQKKYIESKIEIEPQLRLLFKISDVKVILDIGACEAEDSIRYAKLFPYATIFAFEPRADNCESAKRNLEIYKATNIKLENVALSDREGLADFYLSGGNPDEAATFKDWNFGNKSSSLLPPSETLLNSLRWLKFEKPVQVRTTTLRSYLERNNIPLVDLAHIDVQGAELLVLKGAGDRLSSMKVIWMEVEKVALYEKQPLVKEVGEFMRSKGFVNILNTVDQISGDQLFVNKRHFPAPLLFYLQMKNGLINAKNLLKHLFKRFGGVKRIS